jgi:hypothetical protein
MCVIMSWSVLSYISLNISKRTTKQNISIFSMIEKDAICVGGGSQNSEGN